VQAPIQAYLYIMIFGDENHERTHTLQHTTYFPISCVTVPATMCSLLNTLPQSIFSYIVNYWASFSITIVITNVYQFHSNVRDDGHVDGSFRFGFQYRERYIVTVVKRTIHKNTVTWANRNSDKYLRIFFARLISGLKFKVSR